MDQGVIANLNVYYLRRNFAEAFKETDGDDAPTLTQFWKDYNIRHAVANVRTSWHEVSARAMNSAWRNLCTDLCPVSSENKIIELTHEIIRMGHSWVLSWKIEIVDILDSQHFRMRTSESFKSNEYLNQKKLTYLLIWPVWPNAGEGVLVCDNHHLAQIRRLYELGWSYICLDMLE